MELNQNNFNSTWCPRCRLVSSPAPRSPAQDPVASTGPVHGQPGDPWTRPRRASGHWPPSPRPGDLSWLLSSRSLWPGAQDRTCCREATWGHGATLSHPVRSPGPHCRGAEPEGDPEAAAPRAHLAPRVGHGGKVHTLLHEGQRGWGELCGRQGHEPRTRARGRTSCCKGCSLRAVTLEGVISGTWERPPWAQGHREPTGDGTPPAMMGRCQGPGGRVVSGTWERPLWAQGHHEPRGDGRPPAGREGAGPQEGRGRPGP